MIVRTVYSYKLFIPITVLLSLCTYETYLVGLYAKYWTFNYGSHHNYYYNKSDHKSSILFLFSFSGQ